MLRGFIIGFSRLGVFAFILVSVVGCSTFDPAVVRRNQADLFTNSLSRIENELLASPLSLERAISIAMTNNYAVRKADLDVELARLGKNAAFSAFLPQVEAKAGYYAYRDDPLTSSKNYESGSLRASLPLLMPSTWFLYAAQRHGYAAGRISAYYTRQSIALQTTQDYFNILVQEDLIEAYESQYEAANRNAKRIEGLAKEGLHASWEAKQASVLASSRKVQLEQAKRQLGVLRSRLLSGLGLDPRANLTLAGVPEESLQPTNSLPSLVLGALESHPMLAISDRQVVMKEHAVREAFCDFLPNVSLFAEQSWTGNEISVPSENLLLGFNGAWSLFNSFSIFSGYKMSKVELEKTELERENTFLNLIVNIVSAEASLRDAEEAMAVKRGLYEVKSEKYLDYEAKEREGLIPVSEALDALAERDLAEVDLVRSQFDVRLARAALDFAVGSIVTGTEDEVSPFLGRK